MCFTEELLLPFISDYTTQNQLLFLKRVFQTHAINNVQFCLTLRLPSQCATGLETAFPFWQDSAFSRWCRGGHGFSLRQALPVLRMDSDAAAALVQGLGVCSSDFSLPPWLVQGAKIMASVGIGDSLGPECVRCSGSVCFDWKRLFPCPWLGRWNYVIFKVPSKQNHSTILCNLLASMGACQCLIQLQTAAAALLGHARAACTSNGLRFLAQSCMRIKLAAVMNAEVLEDMLRGAYQKAYENNSWIVKCNNVKN